MRITEGFESLGIFYVSFYFYKKLIYVTDGF